MASMYNHENLFNFFNLGFWMYKLIIAAVRIFLFVPLTASAAAQDEMARSLFSQLKTNIEKSCSNDDYLKCIESTYTNCNKITETQLKKIGQIIDTQAQAIADGQITQLLVEIKTARSEVLEENNIGIDMANSCGKQFLIN